jgi:hypothetical protein
MTAASPKSTEQLIVRVPGDTYLALQLALPFVQRRSMQDMTAALIDDFLENLRASDPGFEKALVGLRESQARREGVLSRRTAPGNSSAS